MTHPAFVPFSNYSLYFCSLFKFLTMNLFLFYISHPAFVPVLHHSPCIRSWFQIKHIEWYFDPFIWRSLEEVSTMGLWGIGQGEAGTVEDPSGVVFAGEVHLFTRENLNWNTRQWNVCFAVILIITNIMFILRTLKELAMSV